MANDATNTPDDSAPDLPLQLRLSPEHLPQRFSRPVFDELPDDLAIHARNDIEAATIFPREYQKNAGTLRML